MANQAAHPRRCGENFWLVVLMVRCRGSSPQVRGKLNEAEEYKAADRLIPAGAGKTSR